MTGKTQKVNRLA